MQKRPIVVMILVLLGTSAAVADELCHTTHFTILSRAVDAMQHAMNLLKDFEDEDRHGDIADGLLALQARGDITRLDPGTELYVKEALGSRLFVVRRPGSPDLYLAAAFRGFDCPTLAPKRPTKKPKRP
jgi:hypothetical protein